MTNLEETEARVARALKHVADGVEVTEADLRRTEDGYRETLASRGAGPRRGGRAFAAMVAAATVVLAAALAAVILLGRQDPEPAPAVPTPTALTAKNIVGVWRLDAWSQVPVWAFRSDGALESWVRPEDLVGPAGPELGTFSLAGGTLTLRPSSECVVRLRVSGPYGVQIPVTQQSISSACASELHARWWVTATLTRIAPSEDPRLQPGFRVGLSMEPVVWLSSLTGTWVIPGSSRIIAISEGRYVAGSRLFEVDGRGRRFVDERGSVVVGSTGDVTFRPEGKSCARRYGDATSDYARLELRLERDTCQGSDGATESWMRLN